MVDNASENDDEQSEQESMKDSNASNNDSSSEYEAEKVRCKQMQTTRKPVEKMKKMANKRDIRKEKGYKKM